MMLFIFLYASCTSTNKFNKREGESEREVSFLPKLFKERTVEKRARGGEGVLEALFLIRGRSVSHKTREINVFHLATNS